MIAAIAASILPWPARRWLLRWRGHHVAAGASVGMFTVLDVEHIRLSRGARIGSFSAVRAVRLEMGEGAQLKSLVFVSTHSVELGDRSEISPLNIVMGELEFDRSRLQLGRHSKIFPLCWLEPGYGISIADRVGVGGHSLLFTHGSWANYFNGAPVSHGPITIEDHVWLPWRVFVMPGVTIGARAILGAGSVVTRTVPTGALAAGSPAVVLRESAYLDLDDASLRKRIAQVLDECKQQTGRKLTATVALSVKEQSAVRSGLTIGAHLDADIACNRLDSGMSSIDVVQEVAWTAPGDDEVIAVLDWMRRFGLQVDFQEDSQH